MARMAGRSFQNLFMHAILWVGNRTSNARGMCSVIYSMFDIVLHSMFDIVLHSMFDIMLHSMFDIVLHSMFDFVLHSMFDI